MAPIFGGQPSNVSVAVIRKDQFDKKRLNQRENIGIDLRNPRHAIRADRHRASASELQVAERLGMKVKVKILSSRNDYGWFDFWAGIDLWVNGKNVEIAREPDLAEFESDAEREQGLRIVKGIYDRMAENTNTAYRFRKERLDKLEEETLSISRPILRQYGGTMLNHKLIEELSKFYPSHKEDTIRRRLTEIVSKGQLECKHIGKDVFYELTASDRIKEQIPA